MPKPVRVLGNLITCWAYVPFLCHIVMHVFFLSSSSSSSSSDSISFFFFFSVLFFFFSPSFLGFCSCEQIFISFKHACFIFLCLIIFLYFVHFVAPMGISPKGNPGRFPQGKPAATQSCYPILINYKAHAGSFRVCIIHRTLTWTTGSLACVHLIILTRAYTHGGWTRRQRVSTTFLTRKNSPKFFTCSFFTGFEPQVFGSRVRRFTN